MKFIGRYEHSLDAKGRVILPAKFRSAFERGAFLSQFHDQCLAIWTPEQFERRAEAMQAASELSRHDRNIARFWSSGSAEVEVDKAGRMPIPPYLRRYAGLEAPAAGAGVPVLVVGAIDRVELWNPETWAERVGPAEQDLIDA